jgi:hypothetical protein
MKELLVNLHLHSCYSDGTGTYKEIGEAALQAGLDAVIITDHNVLIRGMEQYLRKDTHLTMLLSGEEVHDAGRQPQKNHLLIFNVNDETCKFATNPQDLIDKANQKDGLTFLAHPFEKSLPQFKEDDISWENWGVKDYTGIELWNGMSEFKNRIRNRIHAVLLAYFPNLIPNAPNEETLTKWDQLLASGRKCIGIGGSDAHALHLSMGPFQKIVFPYLYHFHTINNHIFVPDALSGEIENDKEMIYNAMKEGNLFIGNDLISPTYGFNFTAESEGQSAQMGETLFFKHGCSLRIRLPEKAECTLVKDGVKINHWNDQEIITHLTNQPGIYRIECHRYFLGKHRGWIYSNPIYLRKK